MGTFANTFLTENNIDTPVNDQWGQISSELQNTMANLIPSKLTTTRYNQPWITRHIKRLARRKSRAFKKAKHSKTERDWTRYKTLKKQMQRDCRTTYQEFVNDMICQESGGGSKKFWAYIKSRRCDNVGVAPLMKEGILHSSPEVKAELLNKQFASVFTDEDTQNMPNLGPSPHPEVPLFQITSPGVLKLLQNINPNKATGPDGIPGRVLKECAQELAPVLTHLFQASLHQGKIPHEWKQAHVSPIFKKGDRHQPANYRPVSLTSIVCKLMEHIIHSQVINHLENHEILSSRQFGFRQKRSCETQLLLTIHDLAKGLDDKDQIDAILLDFSKAFDKVPHQRLLLKLHHYGIRGRLLSWVEDFLSSRSQQVLVDGRSSGTAGVTSGVPQGSVLGPLLFLVFINDLPDCVSSEVRLFADDCLMYRPVRDQADAVALQEDLDHLQVWERTWQMSFNADKCEVLRVTNKRKNIIKTDYTIHGNTLRTVDQAKYLGVTIQSNLSWNPHVDNICAKANKTRGFLQRNLRKSPLQLKNLAYKTFVRPTLEYAATVWDPHTERNIQKVEMVQRRAARFVKADFHKKHSVTKMLHDLSWHPMCERRAQAKVVMLYRIVHGLVAIPLTQYFTPSTRIRGHPMQYRQHTCHINAYQYSFFPSAIPLWNNLPTITVLAPSLDTFKDQVSCLSLRQ